MFQIERMGGAFCLAAMAVPEAAWGEVAEAVNDTRGMLTTYMEDHPEFREVGGRMLAAWNEGVTATLST
jgi:hypothetical protein